MSRGFALTEQSVTLMIIVYGRHTELAVISGARSPPPFKFWRYLSNASCWLVAPPADSWWLCVTAQSSQLYAISLHAKVHALASAEHQLDLWWWDLCGDYFERFKTMLECIATQRTTLRMWFFVCYDLMALATNILNIYIRNCCINDKCFDWHYDSSIRFCVVDAVVHN